MKGINRGDQSSGERKRVKVETKEGKKSRIKDKEWR